MSATIEDLRATIVPKSDQINAEQLIAGPMTVTVTDVRVSGSDEQPLTIHYAGESGRPYKPCKTCRKILIFAWGPDGREWIGRSMTLYCDPSVRFGGSEVGGIRISHLSHIPRAIHPNLTTTRGKKALHTIQPLQVAEPDPAPTLDAVLDVIKKIKGAKGKARAESLIEQLPFEDQMTATEALDAQIEAIKGAAA